MPDQMSMLGPINSPYFRDYSEPNLYTNTYDEN